MLPPQGFADDVRYGAFGSIKGNATKSVFLPNTRRRMNFVPIILCIAFPWLLFSLVLSVLTFSWHYDRPGLTWLIVIASLIAAICVTIKATSNRFRVFGSSTERSPSWWIFLSGSLLFSWVVAVVVGSEIYGATTAPYFDLLNLNNYTNVYPNQMQGAQLLDAGIVQFAQGTQLNISQSMGFKNYKMYCVAPIVYGSAAMKTYDFWAVGTDCCSGAQPDFHCSNFNNPSANGGFRLMSSEDRPYYRLAVQQAEATYNITASHPLFLTWTTNPSEKVKATYNDAQKQFVSWMMSYLVFQLFVVLVATVVFSKLGHI
jgi:hypothetical protein